MEIKLTPKTRSMHTRLELAKMKVEGLLQTAKDLADGQVGKNLAKVYDALCWSEFRGSNDTAWDEAAFADRYPTAEGQALLKRKIENDPLESSILKALKRAFDSPVLDGVADLLKKLPSKFTEDLAEARKIVAEYVTAVTAGGAKRQAEAV